MLGGGVGLSALVGRSVIAGIAVAEAPAEANQPKGVGDLDTALATFTFDAEEEFIVGGAGASGAAWGASAARGEQQFIHIICAICALELEALAVGCAVAEIK